MRKAVIVLAMMLFVSGPDPAAAQTVDDRIVAQLRAQGFDEIRMTRTLLGRTRIEAESDSHTREIVINARTGEILRDFWVMKTRGGRADIRLLDPAVSGSPIETGVDNRDDDDDDSRDVDDRDDDGDSRDIDDRDDDDDRDSGDDSDDDDD